MKDETDDWIFTTKVIKHPNWKEKRMSNLEHKEDGDKWTNVTLRQLLGEKGFIERAHFEYILSNHTLWDRGLESVVLIEYRDNSSPILKTTDTGYEVDPATLTVRNPLIQNDGSSDE